MTLEQSFQFINAAKFFPGYCPKVMNWKHKLRGFNGRKNPIAFSDQDKIIIRAGITRFANDLKRLAVTGIK